MPNKSRRRARPGSRNSAFRFGSTAGSRETSVRLREEAVGHPGSRSLHEAGRAAPAQLAVPARLSPFRVVGSQRSPRTLHREGRRASREVARSFRVCAARSTEPPTHHGNQGGRVPGRQIPSRAPRCRIQELSIQGSRLSEGFQHCLTRVAIQGWFDKVLCAFVPIEGNERVHGCELRERRTPRRHLAGFLPALSGRRRRRPPHHATTKSPRMSAAAPFER